MNTVHEFIDVKTHHFVPRNGIQTCACGATYRSGLVCPPPGFPDEPYNREQAIEDALAEDERRALDEWVQQQSANAPEWPRWLTDKIIARLGSARGGPGWTGTVPGTFPPGTKDPLAGIDPTVKGTVQE